jgi:UMF1 family MFS transporter
MIYIVLICKYWHAALTFFASIEKKGNGFAISCTLIIWIIICIAGYYLKEKLTFYALAAF